MLDSLHSLGTFCLAVGFLIMLDDYLSGGLMQYVDKVLGI